MIATIIKNKKLPLWAGWVLGYLLVPTAAVGLAYFWRVGFEQGQVPMLPLTGGILAVLTLVHAALFCIFYVCKASVSFKAALCVFLMGILFCYATPPLQAPDEDNHFLRAYAISMGRFNYDAERSYPDDVSHLVKAFPVAYNHAMTYGGELELPVSAFAQYKQAVEDNAPVEEVVTEARVINFMTLPFLPQAVAIGIARLFGCTALGAMYAGRIGNLLAYAAICYLAFKNCNKFRGVFFALAIIPVSLFMAASNSYDSLMLACCYLIVSYFCKDEIYNHDIIVFGLAVAYASYLKPNNIVLAAVLLLIPKIRWKTSRNPWIAAIAIVAAVLVVRQGFGWVNGMLTHNYPSELPRGLEGGEDVGGQVAFIVKNPLRFIVTALLTFLENSFFMGKGNGTVMSGLGVFGWNDLSIPSVAVLSVLSMCSASALGIQQKDDTRAGGAVALFLAAVCYAGAVIAGLYVTNTDVGAIRVSGLQTRYFLPVFLLLFMLASIMLGKAVQPRLNGKGAATSVYARTELITLVIAVGVALVTVILLFQNNFIGQWIPKAEGGFKLVNLLGWKLL